MNLMSNQNSCSTVAWLQMLYLLNFPSPLLCSWQALFLPLLLKKGNVRKEGNPQKMLQTCDILLSKPLGATSTIPSTPMPCPFPSTTLETKSTCGFHCWEMQCPIVWLECTIKWTKELELINLSLLDTANAVHVTLALERTTVLVSRIKIV